MKVVDFFIDLPIGLKDIRWAFQTNHNPFGRSKLRLEKDFILTPYIPLQVSGPIDLEWPGCCRVIRRFFAPKVLNHGD